MRYRSSGSRPAKSHHSVNWATVWAWVITTPFGRPVVPDVNNVSLASDGSTERRPFPRRLGRHRLPRRDELLPRPARRINARTVAAARSGTSGFGRTVEEDDRAQVGEFGRVVVEHRHGVGAEEADRGEQQRDLRRRQHVRRLGAFPTGVDRHERRAGAVRSEGSDDPAQPVRRPDGDPVAARDSGGHHRPRRFDDAIAEFGVGHADLAVDDGLHRPAVRDTLHHRSRNRGRRRVGLAVRVAVRVQGEMMYSWNENYVITR